MHPRGRGYGKEFSAGHSLEEVSVGLLGWGGAGGEGLLGTCEAGVGPDRVMGERQEVGGRKGG